MRIGNKEYPEPKILPEIYNSTWHLMRKTMSRDMRLRYLNILRAEKGRSPLHFTAA